LANFKFGWHFQEPKIRKFKMPLIWGLHLAARGKWMREVRFSHLPLGAGPSACTTPIG